MNKKNKDNEDKEKQTDNLSSDDTTLENKKLYKNGIRINESH